MKEYLQYFGTRSPQAGRADLHTHTFYSDGVMTPEQLVESALEAGLTAVAVTDHDTIDGALEAWNYAEKRDYAKDLQVVIGEEVTTRNEIVYAAGLSGRKRKKGFQKMHVLALGLTKPIIPLRPLGETMDSVHAQGGLVIAAHPEQALAESLTFAEMQKQITSGRQFDGVEIFNANARKVGSLPVLKDTLFHVDTNSNARSFYHNYTVLRDGSLGAPIGGSDAHGRTLGYGITTYEGRDVLKAIQEKQTSVWYASDIEKDAFLDIAAQAVRGYMLLPIMNLLRAA